MPRAAKATINGNTGVAEIKHVVRVIADRTEEANGIWSAADTELYLQKTYLEQGWDLLDAKVLNVRSGREMGGLNFNPIEMLYILVKYAN